MEGGEKKGGKKEKKVETMKCASCAQRILRGEESKRLKGEKKKVKKKKYSMQAGEETWSLWGERRGGFYAHIQEGGVHDLICGFARSINKGERPEVKNQKSRHVPHRRCKSFVGILYKKSVEKMFSKCFVVFVKKKKKKQRLLQKMYHFNPMVG